MQISTDFLFYFCYSGPLFAKRKEVLPLIPCLNEIQHTDIQNCIIGNKCGTITISVYQEAESGTHIFHVQPDNEDILPICYVIEDALSVY